MKMIVGSWAIAPEENFPATLTLTLIRTLTLTGGQFSLGGIFGHSKTGILVSDSCLHNQLRFHNSIEF